jgi:hypothetical protein
MKIPEYPGLRRLHFAWERTATPAIWGNVYGIGYLLFGTECLFEYDENLPSVSR